MKNLFLTILISTTMMTNHNTCDNAAPKKGTTVRPMAVAGQFYPADKDELNKDVTEYFKSAGNIEPGTNVQAVIVPHAGYVFSGAVAASAFAHISPTAKYDHIFLLGPSHHVSLNGASVCNVYDDYATPLGNVKVDRELATKLINENDGFTYEASAHVHEHCLEVQLPFLQHLFKDVPPIIPIIIGTERLQTLRKIAIALKPYFNARNLFVISSDFSHYPSYADACNVDKRTGEAVMTGNLNQFIDALAENDSLGIRNLATSACGQCAIATLLLMMEGDQTVHIHHLAYRNSGDSPYGGKAEVVGYHAFMIDREPAIKAPADSTFTLTAEDKQTLLTLARNSICDSLRIDHQPTPPLSQALSAHCGAFVTLNENGHLRGCIGLLRSDEPLYQVISEMARAAAFEDPRFSSVTRDEMPLIDIEISVLTPLRRIHSIDEFQYGKQGIYIRKGSRSGTFLPQVADEVNWTKEEFLGHCARDKAGLSWDGWRTAELYTYEAIVIKEK
jgi:AmmeMemoRadiSam system protein B/AmmeMemoRadiSam system protein A